MNSSLNGSIFSRTTVALLTLSFMVATPAAHAQSTQVAGPTIFGPKNYRGKLFSEAKYIESLSRPAIGQARLKIKNADGNNYPIQNCSALPLNARLECLVRNGLHTAYIELFRVDSATIYINGVKYVDSSKLNQNVRSFEVTVPLKVANSLDIRIKGLPTAFIDVEMQAMESNIAPIARVGFQQPLAGVPRTVSFDASASTDANDQITSYRFQAKLQGTSSYTLDSDWIGTPIGSLTFNSVGTYDVLVSARDTHGAIGTAAASVVIRPNAAPTLQISYNILSNNAPFGVQFRAMGEDADGDSLQYNFAFSNGQTTGFLNSNSAFTGFNAGPHSATVTVRDQNGATASGTVNFELGNNRIPIPIFTFIPGRAGNAPLTITFDASASTDPDGPVSELSYLWNFGDGSPEGSGRLAEHTFATHGEYLVTLSVIDRHRGTAAITRAVFAWKDLPPVPRYTHTPVPGSLTVNFDASTSTPGDSAIAAYTIDFGNGVVTRQSSPYFSYTYAAAGVYSTSLRVYDQEGDANVAGLNVTVFNGQKPTANINLVSSDVVTPATFVMNASGSVTPNSGATLNLARWTLPNGEIRNSASITYTTSQHGNFDITLQVRDSFGFWSDPVTRTFSATSGVLPIANITASKTNLALSEVVNLSGVNSYTLNATANLNSYEWTMPDGSIRQGMDQSVSFDSAGEKVISLVVKDSKGYVSLPAQITLNVAPPKPTAIMLLSDGGNIIPVNRHGDGRESFANFPGGTIVSYEWHITAPQAFPNGIDFNLNGAEVDILFNQAVTFTVALRVTDSAGGVSDWVSETFGPLENTAPIARVSPASITVVAPSMVNFTSFGSFDPDGHEITGYYWNFGDGGEAYEPNPTHYFNVPGNYSVALSVRDEYGVWSDAAYSQITVRANQAPIAIITMQNDPAGNRMKKIFSAASSSDPDGTISNYFWYVHGSGIFASGVNTEFTFPGPGHYVMGLDVYDDKGAVSQASYDVDIPETAPPVAKIIVSGVDHNTRTVQFSGSESTHESDALTYSWSFGDTNVSNEISPSHVYSASGEYIVSLRVTDSRGQTDSTDTTVFVSSDTLQIVAESFDGNVRIEARSNDVLPIPNLPSSVNFSVRALDGSISEIPVVWNFGDGVTSNDPEPSHMFYANEPQVVSATFTNQYGQAVTQNITVMASTNSCIRHESDNTCAYVTNAIKAVLSKSENSVSIAVLERLLPSVEQLQLEISQPNAIHQIPTSAIQIVGNRILFSTSQLRQASFDENLPYSIRIRYYDELEDIFVGATVGDFEFNNGSVQIEKFGPTADIALTIEDRSRLNRFSRTLTDSGISMADLGPGLYRVYGENENGFVDGTITVENGRPSQIKVAPQSNQADAYEKSVIEVFAPIEPSAGRNVQTNLELSGGSELQVVAQEVSGCMANGQPCIYGHFSSPFRYQEETNWIYKRSAIEGPELPFPSQGSRAFGSYSTSDESQFRGIDERFKILPGERFEVECKGYTSRWAYDLLGDRSDEAVQAMQTYQAYNHASTEIGTMFSVLPRNLQTACPAYAPTSCGDQFVNTVNDEYAALWRNFVERRAPLLPLYYAWESYSQTYDAFKIAASLVGKRSQHEVFEAEIVLTRYNSNGSVYLDSNNKRETKFFTILYDTSRMRGDFSVDEAVYSIGNPRNAFRASDRVSSKVERNSVLIPSSWSDFRASFNMKGRNAYRTVPIDLPTTSNTANTASSFSCRPTFKSPGVTILAAETNPATTEALRSSIASSFVDSAAVWNHAGVAQYGYVWNVLKSKSIVEQQRYLESRSPANSALNSSLKLSGATIRQMGRLSFENYVSTAFFSQSPLFPMDIDRDASINRNPTHRALLVTETSILNGTNLTESDFNIRTRLKLRTRGVKAIHTLHVLMNGIRFHSIPLVIGPIDGRSESVFTPVIEIPYASIRDAVPASLETTGNRFNISFEIAALDTDNQTLISDSKMNLALLPVWNLKPEVASASDVGNGLYGQMASVYGGSILRNYLKSLVALRAANTNNPMQAFNVFVNDGSLPYGSAFSPVHKTHSNGRVLDIRPLGNAGPSGSHYDGANAARRIRDVAAVWAESIYRFEECRGIPEGSPERDACETLKNNEFKNAYLLAAGFSFETIETRLGKWVNLNQHLNRLNSANISPHFYLISGGKTRFSELCANMISAFALGASRPQPADGCTGKTNGLPFTTNDLEFQQNLLRGILPTGDTIRNTTVDANIPTRFIASPTTADGHYNHFHIEVQP